MISMAESSLWIKYDGPRKIWIQLSFSFCFSFWPKPLYNRTWTLREATTLVFHKLLVFRICKHNANTIIQGVKLIFFSDSQLAPKLFKVVANSKKVGRHFQRQTNPFSYTVIILGIKLGKRSLTYYKVDNRMDDMQRLSSPKSILNLVINWDACAVFWKQT